MYAATVGSRRRNRKHAFLRRLTPGVAAAMLAALIQAPPAAAAKPLGRPKPTAHRPDKVAPFVAPNAAATLERARQAEAATAAAARRAAEEQAALGSAAKRRAAGTSLAGPDGAVSSSSAEGTADGGGDYSATPLSASSTWSAGGSAGSFSWSYPIAVPKAAAGPAPSLEVTYDSGSVDGRLPSVNNQASWVGEGFELSTSYIERSYQSCRDDGHKTKTDLCWKNWNASIVLNGKSTALIKDDDTGVWRLEDDDASKVERLEGGFNGARNGEHWKVTTADGTVYMFGLERLPGADLSTWTHSVWTVPVFGDDGDGPGGTVVDEPCYQPTFANASCQQAWRWNLDYVVDLHGNAASYWYTEEGNNYAKNRDETVDSTPYIRGGYLKRIDYGQRASTLFTAPASHQVSFTTAERCVAPGTGCDSLTEATKANWPDVPFESICTSTKCTGQYSPAFFTRKRLVGITTKVWDAALPTPAYRSIDGWTLRHSYLDPGDTGDATDQSLWLNSIQLTTAIDGAPALAPVRFTHQMLTNRVDGNADNIVPMNKPRIYTITSETGAVTTVNYSIQDCLPGTPMPAKDSNTRRCFPVYWYPNGVEDPKLDWFHKYVVTTVHVSDPTGGALDLETVYQYTGGGAWHFAEDPITPKARRTWSQWRGYTTVTTLSGNTDEGPRSKTVNVYLRGMHGDRNADDTRKVVTVTGINAPAIQDKAEYAGFHRESVDYLGEAGGILGGQVNTPWSLQKAAQDFGDYTARAFFVRTATTQQRTVITSPASTRLRTTTTAFDTHGMPTSVDDAGNDALPGDETCTLTWYARNLGKNFLSPVGRTQTLGRRCADAPTAVLPPTYETTGDVISDVATSYDSLTWTANQVPSIGDARWIGRASGYTTGRAPLWQMVSTAVFDSLGRVTRLTDAKNVPTTTTYVPAATGPLTRLTLANVRLHATTTTLDISRGQPTKIVDPNGKVTESTYDALGRVTQVWLATNLRAFGAKPNYTFGYNVSATAPSWTSKSSLRRDGTTYNTTFTIHDALLRTRQVQTPSPLAGRIITETLYNSKGLTSTSYTDIWDNTSPPTGTLMGTVNGQAPAETATAYDAAGRTTTTAFKSHGITRWTTTTSYTGDSVATTGPTGGSARRVFTDALGRTTERREYKSTSPTATTFMATKYAFDGRGRLATITGPDNAVWRYTYDLHGRTTRTVDPDSGTAITGYTALNQVDSTTDPNNNLLLFGYDDLGRKTDLWKTARTDANKLANWTFDTVAKGQPAQSTRYDGGVAGKAYIQRVTAYDAMYRPRTRQIILPTTDQLVTAGVPSTMTFSTSYHIDGTVASQSAPAVAGLPAESVTTQYNTLGMPLKLAGASGYVQATAYSPLGDVEQVQLGTAPQESAKQAWIAHTYETGTRRLTRSFVTDQTNAWMAQDLNYSYDPAGNVTSILDPTTRGVAGKFDYQCFTYDGYRQLADAWTPKTPNCAATGRTTANLGGAAPYWSAFTYTTTGLRRTETQRSPTGTTAAVTYNYGTNLAARPHALLTTGTVVTPAGGTPGPTTTKTYTYDAAGNTKTRPGMSATTQTLDWDAERHLTKASEPAAGNNPARSQSHLYDAAGELLIKRPTTGGDGETVLYLGPTEVRLKVAGATKTFTGTRYYTHAGATVAVRTVTGGTTKLTWLAADRHGTASLAIDSVTQAPTKRHTTPFGAPRGTQPTWPDDKRFLGKPADTSTGLTHIGAREYDPNIGRFVSVDPILDTENPLSFNAYAYASNSPVTNSDPTGLNDWRAKCKADTGKNCSTPGPDPDDNDSPDSTTTTSGGGAQPVKKANPPCVYAMGSGNCSGGYNAPSTDYVFPDDGYEYAKSYTLRGYEDVGYCGYPASCRTYAYVSDLPWYGQTIVYGLSLVGAAVVFAPVVAGLLPSAASAAITIGPAATSLVDDAPVTGGVVKASSVKLAKALIESGTQRPINTAAHHIVAGGKKMAEPARQVLLRFGIGINDAVNGVFLTKNTKVPNALGTVIHATLPDKYYDRVNALLGSATTREQVVDTLNYISKQLQSGNLP